jgi:hypothetical protein
VVSVFQRAIRNCPWAKALYMLAFEHLAAADGDDDDHHRHRSISGRQSSREDNSERRQQFRRIYEVIREKDLRIHVDLDALLGEA